MDSLKFGKYTVSRKLGKGSMGDVYYGIHPNLDIPIAIKTLSAKVLHDKNYIERFIKEAKLAARIKHENAVMIYDADASAGQFSKRLVSLLKVVMRRNGGGNSTSINRGELTDLYLSPEGIEDIRNWGVDEVDPVTRRDLIVGDGGLLTRIFNVNPPIAVTLPCNVISPVIAIVFLIFL